MPNTIHLHSAQRALDALLADVPDGPAYKVEANLFVNVVYPGNTQSFTLDSKRNDIAGFEVWCAEVKKSMQVAARAAADAGEVTDDGILTISP